MHQPGPQHGGGQPRRGGAAEGVEELTRTVGHSHVRRGKPMPFKLMPDAIDPGRTRAALFKPLPSGSLKPVADSTASGRGEGEGHALAEVLLKAADGDALRG